MPCINPHTVINPRYRSSEKHPYPCYPDDPRELYIVVPCGRCVECRRRRASDWRIRMLNELRYDRNKRFTFVTLTFSREAFEELREQYDLDDDNEVVAKALRLFLGRYRKKYGVSLRHFMVTDIGDDDEHIHLHGIVMNCQCGYYKRGKWYIDKPLFDSLWSYGYTWLGWCNERTISYILKYCMKVDPRRPEYLPKIFVSPGLGRGYVDDWSMIKWHNSTDDGIFYVMSSNGYKQALPRYYRLKLFSEDFLRKRTLRLLDEPPPLVFRGKKFDDVETYEAYLRMYYKVTLRNKSSVYVKPINMRSNDNSILSSYGFGESDFDNFNSCINN